MILIADSGSTKTAWRLIDDNGNIHQAETNGLNPWLTNESKFIQTLKEGLPNNWLTERTKEIHFYGAGCGSQESQKVINKWFNLIFKNAEVSVCTDLLAAARATCGKSQGIACILGTGSNTCFYNGNKIAYKAPSMGYVLGDEGSGNYMGKKLLKAYYNKQLPPHLAKSLETEFNMSKDHVLDHVYKQPQANKYLASFAKFIGTNQNDTFLAKFVYDIFSEFLDQVVLLDPEHKYKVNFVGSIAHHFSNILTKATKDAGFQIGVIIQSPIAGLTLYHKEKQ